MLHSALDFLFKKFINKLTFFGLIYLNVINSFSQNIVRNYSFEDNTFIPNCFNAPTAGTNGAINQDLYNYWHEVDYWTTPLKRFCITHPGVASADCLCSPGVAKSGLSYGFGTSREYIVQQLLNSINNGDKLYYEFYTKSFDVNGGLISKSGIKLYDKRPNQCGYYKLHPKPNKQPQIEIINKARNGQWHKVYGYWLADDNYSWITLGNFSTGNASENTLFWDDIKIFNMQQEDCIDIWYIQNEVYDNENRFNQVSDKIIAGENVTAQYIQGPVLVKSNSNVIYRAGNQVVLEPGFSTEPGAYFEAVIGPCEANPCPPPPIINDQQQACFGNPINIGVSNPDQGQFYEWSPATYLDNPTSPNPLFTPPPGEGVMNYTVVVTSICNYFGSPFPIFMPAVQQEVLIYYNDNPNPNPTISLQNIQTSDYSFGFDATYGSQTLDTIVIPEQTRKNFLFAELGGAGILYSLGYGKEFYFKNKPNFKIALRGGLTYLQLAKYRTNPVYFIPHLQNYYLFKLKKYNKISIVTGIGVTPLFDFYEIFLPRNFPCGANPCGKYYFSYLTLNTGVQLNITSRKSLNICVYYFANRDRYFHRGYNKYMVEYFHFLSGGISYNYKF